MRRDGVDYLECSGCGEVFEAADLEQLPDYDDSGDMEEREGGASRSSGRNSNRHPGGVGHHGRHSAPRRQRVSS